MVSSILPIRHRENKCSEIPDQPPNHLGLIVLLIPSVPKIFVTFWRFDSQKMWRCFRFFRYPRRRRVGFRRRCPEWPNSNRLLDRRWPPVSSCRCCSVFFSTSVADPCYHNRRNWIGKVLDSGRWRFPFGPRNPRLCRPVSPWKRFWRGRQKLQWRKRRQHHCSQQRLPASKNQRLWWLPVGQAPQLPSEWLLSVTAPTTPPWW